MQTLGACFSSHRSGQGRQAMESPRDSNTAGLPRTGGCPQPCRRHDFPDRGGYLLSALVGRRVSHVTASTSLPKADEQRGRGRKVQPLCATQRA